MQPLTKKGRKMITVNIRETDEFIKLGQALKKQVL